MTSKKIARIFLLLASILVMLAGCSKDVKTGKKVIKEGTVECDWFENAEVDEKFRMSRIFFSGNDDKAILNYVYKNTANTTIEDYYRIYISERKEDAYTIPQELTFEKKLFPMFAAVNYAGDKVFFVAVEADSFTSIDDFPSSCQLYVGDLSGHKVKNAKKVQGIVGDKKIVLTGIMKDDSILFNTTDEDGNYQMFYAAPKEAGYEVQEMKGDCIKNYDAVLTYAGDDKVYCMLGTKEPMSFELGIAEIKNGELVNLENKGTAYLKTGDVEKFYTMVGFDRAGGLYFYEIVDNQIKLERGQG